MSNKLFDLGAFLEVERWGPKVYYRVMYLLEGEWKTAGGTVPRNYRTLEAAKYDAEQARYDTRVTETMVVEIREVSWSDLETKLPMKNTQYSALLV